MVSVRSSLRSGTHHRRAASEARDQPLFYDLNLVENHRLIGSVQTIVGLIVLKYLRKKFTREIIRLLVEQVRRLPTGSELAKAIYTVFAAVKERREIEEFLARAREMRYTDREYAGT